MSTLATTRRAAGASAARITLALDGTFLFGVGLLQMALELLGHFFGRGLYAAQFSHSPYTIGFFEAHGLAALVGILLIRAMGWPDRRFWHLFAVGVHLLLGGANLLFWISFTSFGMVPMGIVVTAIHGLFVAAQLACFMSSAKR